jgi:hypothetical protein
MPVGGIFQVDFGIVEAALTNYNEVVDQKGRVGYEVVVEVVHFLGLVVEEGSRVAEKVAVCVFSKMKNAGKVTLLKDSVGYAFAEGKVASAWELMVGGPVLSTLL